MTHSPPTQSFKRAVLFVAVLNLAYFGVEFAAAAAIGSVSLFADSIDFLEDASVNLLILVALAWSPGARARVGMLLAATLMFPAVATLWTAWGQFTSPAPPEPIALTLTGGGALVVNLACAFVLARHHKTAGSLSKAAFLSARNDAIANIAIIAAGLLTAATLSIWPDLIVGLAIAAMNADAARQVWFAAHREHRQAES
ncbi:MAG: cation transporter [Maricaulaceae bacterium]|jgi:Co/Zn/Cd efflux system component